MFLLRSDSVSSTEMTRRAEKIAEKFPEVGHFVATPRRLGEEDQDEREEGERKKKRDVIENGTCRLARGDSRVARTRLTARRL